MYILMVSGASSNYISTYIRGDFLNSISISNSIITSMAFGNEEWIVEQCLVFEGCFRSEVSKKGKKGENSEKGEREEIALTAARASIGNHAKHPLLGYASA